ncbi:MAG: hypothetical protein QOH72_2887 [Solirubrobacteraceae bacterium]|jgi:hypothetical protein|nr:hypothetical protein [Solirubrobacteraceae bacterium]
MRRLLASLAAVAAALAITACGNKQAETLHGSTEGSYLDLGGMKYQVQISRLLNPASIEDKYYFTGVSAADRQLPAGQEWFAVFIRVENDGRKAARAATDYTITDTQNTKFRPIQIGADNAFGYRGGTLQPTDVLPAPDSPAGQGSIQGALLLFKIPTTNLENRPLELAIRSADAPGKTATVDLDV